LSDVSHETKSGNLESVCISDNWAEQNTYLICYALQNMALQKLKNHRLKTAEKPSISYLSKDDYVELNEENFLNVPKMWIMYGSHVWKCSCFCNAVLIAFV